MYQAILDRIYNRPHMVTEAKLEAIRLFVTAKAFGLEAPTAWESMRAESDQRKQIGTSQSVAVLPIVGTLAKRAGMLEDSSGGMSMDRIGRDFDRLIADESVSAIVLDIDSPGGESFGTQELTDKIFAARGIKPVVAVANPEAASAAYHIASAAEQISVTPSGWVGSIGVVMAHVDMSKLNETLGRNVTYIHAGKYKVEGNSNQPLSEESVAYLQSQVDEIYDRFLKAVARGRNTTTADVKANYGQGRMLLASDAKRAGMVDRVETIEEAIARLVHANQRKRAARARNESLKLY